MQVYGLAQMTSNTRTETCTQVCVQVVYTDAFEIVRMVELKQEK